MPKSLTDLKIGDLVEVPVVKTVIDMSEVRDLDPDDPEGRVALESLSHSFVITEDIEKILAVILESFRSPTGQGFFIIGTYGSGKSHLLSVLGLLARYSWAKTSVFSANDELPELAEALETQRLLPVMIPLTEYPGDTPLEKIIWHETEQAAAVAGIPLSLSYSVRYIELFNRYILPVHSKEFLEYIQARFDDVTWEQICRDDLASAHTIIVQFINRKNLTIPFEIATDRKALMDSLISSLKESNWDGVFFIIDELSEFLKSKASAQQLNEDTRFLQYLGEASANFPVWIVAALQETIERTGEIAPDVFKKIKDRYHQRLRLTTRHLHELVAKRLIRRKNQQAVQIIGQLYSSLKRGFNQIPVTQETFTSIYPVHPETLELLNQNIDLFSQRRGVVDFLTARIGGRPGSQIPGILDKPCTYLLTPDVIFDHFIDRLSESPQFSQYYLLYQQQMLSRIENLFSDSTDRDAALRTAKTLIILAVSPLSESRSTRELANMILYRVMDDSISVGEANYAYFEERILRVLYENISAIRKISSDSSRDDRYYIELLAADTESLEDRIARIKPGLVQDWKPVMEEVITSMSHGQFPLAVFFKRTSFREAILWQNSRRCIAVRVHNFQDIGSADVESLRTACSQGTVDISLLIASPGDPASQQLQAQRFLASEPDDTSHCWYLCIPKLSKTDDTRHAVLEVQACNLLLNETSLQQDETGFQEITERRERFLDELRERVMEGVRSGVFLTSEGQVTIQRHKRYASFDQWLETAVDTPLQQRFPDHSQIATEIDSTSRVIQDLLMEKFIKPGRTRDLSNVQDAALISALDHIAVPLGLARKTGNHYLLTCNPRTSTSVSLILNQLPVTETYRQSIADRTVSAGRVWLRTHMSTFGMSRPVFDLTLAGMIRKGYVNAFMEDVLLDINNMRLPLTGQIKRLGRGLLISDELRPAFSLVYKALTGKNPGEIDLDAQLQLWKKLFDQSSNWQTIVASFRENYSIIQARFPDYAGRITSLSTYLEIVDTVAAMLNEMDVNSVDWNEVLPVLGSIDEFSSLSRILRKLKTFNQTVFTSYLVAVTYLCDSRLKLPDQELYDSLRSLKELATSESALSDELILESGFKAFLSRFEAFRSSYSQVYLQEHSARQHEIQEYDFHAIFTSREARLLIKLQEIPFVRRAIKPGKCVQQILALKRSLCSANPSDFLSSSPICSCGFSLGDTRKLPDTHELQANMQLQLRLAMDLIQTPEVIKPLLANPQISETTRKKVSELNEIDDKPTSFVQEIEKHLDSEVISAVKDVHILKKPEKVVPLSGLLDVLDGQSMTLKQAKKRIESWVNSVTEISDDDWIRFK